MMRLWLAVERLARRCSCWAASTAGCARSPRCVLALVATAITGTWIAYLAQSLAARASARRRRLRGGGHRCAGVLARPPTACRWLASASSAGGWPGGSPEPTGEGGSAISRSCSNTVWLLFASSYAMWLVLGGIGVGGHRSRGVPGFQACGGDGPQNSVFTPTVTRGLTFLRVFSLGPRSDALLDTVARYWRHLGKRPDDHRSRRGAGAPSSPINSSIF